MIALFFLGDRVAGYFLKKVTVNSQFRYSKMYRGDADCEILLLGNSRGLVFYQPYIEKITGKKTFNLSYNAMPINLGRILLEDYLEHHEKPEMLLLDATMINRIDTTLIAGFNVYAPYSKGLDSLVGYYTPEVLNGGKLSHLFLHNSEIFQRVAFHYNNTDTDWLIDRVISDAMVAAVPEQKPFYVGPFDSLTVNLIYQELKNTVSIAQQNGIRVELVVSPFFPPFEKKIVNMEAFIRRVEQTTRLKVRNYATTVQDRNGFGDYQHLNKKGAQIYIDQMFEDGVFK